MRNSWILALALVALLLLPLGADATSQPSAEWPQIRLVNRWSGFQRPVVLTHAGDDSGRIFVAEQTGRIRIVQNNALLPAPFLDISDRIRCCGEQGLLGLAFPPGFVQKQYFYVNYIDLAGNTVVARFGVQPGYPNLADEQSEVTILYQVQPATSHNGGNLAFGPDDNLYLALGDGAYSNPSNQNINGQARSSLLGKLLRIDVEALAASVPPRPAPPAPAPRRAFLPLVVAQGTPRYLIPADNPFAAQPGWRGEIWALGLRNPWRFSFDRATGDLMVGDVGQERVEEINWMVAGQGGANFGWPILEGNQCYLTPGCSGQGFTGPTAQYDHAQGGCAVVAGVTYRGPGNAALQGIHFYGDYCGAGVWGMRRTAGGWESAWLLDPRFAISSFGEDQAGRAYVLDWQGGIVYEIAQG